MPKLLTVFSSIIALALFLAGCENVEVDSSSAGNAKLAASSSVYIEPDFPETDDAREPKKGVNDAVHEAIGNVLRSKGYQVTQDADSADIVISGSYEEGKVMNNNNDATTFSSSAMGSATTQSHAHSSKYLFLKAKKGGEVLWSANTPLAGGTIDAGVQALMASFPSAGN